MNYTGNDKIVPKEAFEHFGIKGMKWGVRRSKSELGYSDKPKNDKDAMTAYQNQKAFVKGRAQKPIGLEGIKDGNNTKNWSNTVNMDFHGNRPPMQEYLSKNPKANLTVEQMDKINAPDKKKYAEMVYSTATGKSPKPLHEMNDSERKKAYEAIEDLYQKNGINEVKDRLNNSVVNKTKPDKNDLNALEFYKRETGYYLNPTKSDIETSKGSSSGKSFPEIVELVNSGKLNPSALDDYFNNIAQSDQDVLEHYGVKGMRWGVRKEVTVEKQLSVDREKAFKQLYDKRAQMDTKELRDVVDRMRLENEMARLANDASRLTDTRTEARKFIDNFKDESLKQVQKAATDQAIKLAREQLQKSFNSALNNEAKKSK